MRNPDVKDLQVTEQQTAPDGRLTWESPAMTEAEYEETAGGVNFQLYGESLIYT